MHAAVVSRACVDLREQCQSACPDLINVLAFMYLAQISLEWMVTQEGLLAREVAVLDQMLTDKLEMAALLNTVGTDVSAGWVTKPQVPDDFSRDTALQESQGPSSKAHQADDPGPHRNPAGSRRGQRVQAKDVQAEQLVFNDKLIDAKALSESFFLNLDLSILEVRCMAPTK